MTTAERRPRRERVVRKQPNISPPGLEGGRYRPLTDEQVQRIHAAALSVLERTGVEMVESECRQILAEAGAREVIAALEGGDFYASTGVELLDVQRSTRRVEIRIKPDAWSRYTTRFIGKDGRVLAESAANPAVYDIKGDEGYVRAVVLESNGKKAWVQPVMLGAAR